MFLNIIGTRHNHNAALIKYKCTYEDLVFWPEATIEINHNKRKWWCLRKKNSCKYALTFCMLQYMKKWHMMSSSAHKLLEYDHH